MKKSAIERKKRALARQASSIAEDLANGYKIPFQQQQAYNNTKRNIEKYN